MLDVALLGTGGMMPLPDRFLTSLLVRNQGDLMLIDCGEGTQVTMKMLGWGYKKISVICFTHVHADHISGLPGLLLAIGNSGRTEPIVIIGPSGIKNIVNSLRIITPVLPFNIEYVEIKEKEERFQYLGLEISSIYVEHTLPCYAYKIKLLRKGKFNVEKAKKLNLPVSYWSTLQNGSHVEYNDVVYLPEQVLDEARKGLQVVYSTDLRPSDTLVEFAKDSDLFICEGINATDDTEERARKYKHCLFSEAAVMAKKANVSELWLTHFSPSLTEPEEYEYVVKEIFPNGFVGKDRMTKNLRFID